MYERCNNIYSSSSVLDRSEDLAEAGRLKSAPEHLDALLAELVLVERQALRPQPRLAHQCLGHLLRPATLHLVAAQVQLLPHTGAHIYA